MMVILLEDVPVETRHNMTKGRTLEVIRHDERRGVWVQGDGEEVLLHPREYNYVKEEK